MRLLALAFVFAATGLRFAHAADYLNSEALGERLNEIAKAHPELVRVRSLAKTREGRDIRLVEIGRGDEKSRRTRPAMLVVAGIEGNDLAGSAAALKWIERLLEQPKGPSPLLQRAGLPIDTVDEDRGEKEGTPSPDVPGLKKRLNLRLVSAMETSRLLDTTTIYFVPRLNPDAAENFFAKPPIESASNNKPFDDDHDGLIDEDGPEDLNGDGRIAMMRVKDPEGEYILDPAEPRLLMKADKAKGEAGTWRLHTEGRDNDADEKWNEDGRGGVNFDRNFPFGYEWFAADAGIHQVSEPETRALADFVIENPNIGVVFTFGAADNLVEEPKAEPSPEGRKAATAISEDDLPYYRELGKIYRKALGMEEELEGKSQHGSFSDWMYFHRGRLSLATRPWSPEMQVALAKAKKKNETKDDATDKSDESDESDKSDEKDDEKDGRDGKKEDDRNKEEREFLKWVDENAPDVFIPWKEFDHPDFPDRQVEIGGYAAFAKTVPPPAMLDALTTKHADLLTTLALRLPRIGIRSAKVKHLGKSVSEIIVQVENAGYLPTMLKHGEVTREVFPTRVVLDLPDEAFLSGTKMTRLSAIEGSGGWKEIRWIVHAQDREQIDVEVISVLGGTVKATLELDGDK